MVNAFELTSGSIIKEHPHILLAVHTDLYDFNLSSELSALSDFTLRCGATEMIFLLG